MRYPSVKQDGIKDCGPCSLAMVIKYYGGGIKYGILAGIGMAITFIAGIVDGFLRPLKCN